VRLAEIALPAGGAGHFGAERLTVRRALVLFLASHLGAFAPGQLAAQVEVRPDGPVATIGAALRQVPAGGHILVRGGVYRERLLVDRAVTIEGQGWPVIDGGGEQAVTVTADSVTIRGLVIRNVSPSGTEDRAGIKLVGTHGCVIENNRLDSTFFGIYVAASRGCRITGNRIRGTGAGEMLNGNAIHLWNDTSMTVEGNDLQGHRDGVYLEFNRHAQIRRNRSRGNRRYGLHFMFSDSCDYQENVFSANGVGVAVMYSRVVSMAGNRFEGNWGPAAYGLLLKDISDSRVDSNQFVSNTVGLYAEGGNRLAVRGNRFLRNGWAVKLMASAQDNTFTGNDFEANSFDVATNSRSNTSAFARNHWDHYAGYDLDRDGYGDVPFRPVRLYSLVAQQNPPALILMRSLFIDLLDLAERVLPVLTPETLIDRQPLMRWPR